MWGINRSGNSSKKNCLFDECVLGVRANVFTTNELKNKNYHKEQSNLSTTSGHNVRAIVNVHVVNSDKWLNLWFLMLQASMCDEQLMSIGGEIALSSNTPPHQWRRNRHSARSRFPSTIASQGSMIPSGSTIVHLPHFNNFCNFCWNQSTIWIHRNFSTFDSFLIFAILASFNLFWALANLASLNLFFTISSISIASTANLTSLVFWTPLYYLSNVSAQSSICPISAQNSSIFYLPKAFVNMSARFDSDATFTTRKCFAATRSCSHSILVWMWRVLLPVPLREAIAFALEESVCNESCSSKFQSANKLCKPNPEHPPFVRA